MIIVTIIQLGPLRVGLKLTTVVDRANRAQQSYFFRLGDSVESTGEPDAEQGRYTFDRLASRLATRRDENTQLLVGVTDHAVHDEMFSAVAKDLSCIIVSTDDIQTVLKTDGTTDTGYVLFEIAAQLLTIEYRRLSEERFPPTECGAPWHRERRRCIFYWDEERQHTGQKMLEPGLCPPCDAALDRTNVAASFSTAAIGIAKSGLQPIQAWFRRKIANPWVVALTSALASALASIVIWKIIG